MQIIKGALYHNANIRMEKLITSVVGRRVFYIRFYRCTDGWITIGGGNSSVRTFINWADNPDRKHKPFRKLSLRGLRKSRHLTI